MGAQVDYSLEVVVLEVVVLEVGSADQEEARPIVAVRVVETGLEGLRIVAVVALPNLDHREGEDDQIAGVGHLAEGNSQTLIITI